MKRAVVAGLVLAFAAAFSLTVWPTRWRVEASPYAGEQVTMRTDRLTGEVQILTGGGWRSIRATVPVAAAATSTAPRPPRKPCTADEQRKIKENTFMAIVLDCENPAPPTTP